MRAPTRAQYRTQERHIGNVVQATKFFVVELGATDEEVIRLFTAQLEFAHKLIDLGVSWWQPRGERGDETTAAASAGEG